MAKMYMFLDDEWTRVPVPDEIHGEVVHHYTNPSGLLGILSHDELWASSAIALNDLSEMTYGLDVLREATEDREDAPSKLLHDLVEAGAFAPLRDSANVLCASTNGDSLNQWIGYAGRQGYAIGIRTEGRLTKRLRDGQEKPGQPNMPTDGALLGMNAWYRVIYDRADQIRLVNELLDFCIKHELLKDGSPTHTTHAITIFGILITQFKHRAFEDEREVRFITGRSDEAEEEFRAGTHGVVPYTRLIAAEKNEHDSAHPTGLKLPLASVTIGPTNEDERELVIQSTKRLLAAKGYGTVDVETSSAPYRY